jgi:hypothetical protein
MTAAPAVPITKMGIYVFVTSAEGMLMRRLRIPVEGDHPFRPQGDH